VVTTVDLERLYAAARREARPNPLRQALEYREVLDKHPCLSKSGLARNLGIGREWLHKLLKLLDLSPRLQEFVLADDGGDYKAVFTVNNLRPIAQLETHREQEETFRELLRQAGVLPSGDNGGACSLL